jgi:hypothetical protein
MQLLSTYSQNLLDLEEKTTDAHRETQMNIYRNAV